MEWLDSLNMQITSKYYAISRMPTPMHIVLCGLRPVSETLQKSRATKAAIRSPEQKENNYLVTVLPSAHCPPVFETGVVPRTRYLQKPRKPPLQHTIVRIFTISTTSVSFVYINTATTTPFLTLILLVSVA